MLSTSRTEQHNANMQTIKRICNESNLNVTSAQYGYAAYMLDECHAPVSAVKTYLLDSDEANTKE